MRNWVAIRLKKCLLCVDKTKLNTNHPRGYVAIASLFHKTHVKMTKMITCGEGSRVEGSRVESDTCETEFHEGGSNVYLIF